MRSNAGRSRADWWPFDQRRDAGINPRRHRVRETFRLPTIMPARSGPGNAGRRIGLSLGNRATARRGAHFFSPCKAAAGLGTTSVTSK
jgi:hypothetical protein